jgi:DNA-binding PadR family transcriptional regulator
MRTSGGMTHLVDRLEQEGLVERVADPHDRRGLLVGLTRKGRALVRRVAPSHLETERRLLATLTPQEQADLARLLRKVLIGLEAQSADPRHPRQANVPNVRPRRPRRRRRQRNGVMAAPSSES